MKEITATGQTVEEAVESALAQLQTTRDRIDIQIVDEGKKGIFRIFGSKPAVIKASLKVDPIEEAKNYLSNVCEKMGASVKVDVKKEGKWVQFELIGKNLGLLIGKRGQTLNSLQYLTQLVLNRYSDHYFNVLLDAEDYRKRRKQTLVQLAERLAQKAIKTGLAVELEPMPSHERKAIHTALVENKQVTTFSKGEDKQRHIVISPVK